MLDDNQILAIVAQELANSSGGGSDSIQSNREDALSAYLGSATGTEVEGKSQVVSTDVADAIEWIMPEIVKAFTQNNEVVTFDANFEGDEKQARMESQYVYDILMKDNAGFIAVHEFIKDCLMQKNGFFKAHYSPKKTEKTESYTGLTEPEFMMLTTPPTVEVIALTINEDLEIPTYDVKVKRVRDCSKIEVMCVAPEEIRVNRMHNSVDISTARFSAHVVIKTASDLIQDGIDKGVVEDLPSAYDDSETDYRFNMQGEIADGTTGNNTLDDSTREIEVAECYMYIDIEETGVAEYMKITVSGGDNPDTVLSTEPLEESPLISATAIIMSHKLFGLSIYDRLKQIQSQKTTLWRNILDNMYLQNNQRTIAVESQVNLDDLLVSRPGGIIRAKRIDAVAPYVTPSLGQGAYQMMDYLDKVAAGRTGVSPDGAVTDNMVGDRVGSQGIEKMMNQKEELVGLMIRVIAETAIKPLCYMIRGQAIKHQNVLSDYNFSGDWVKVNPSTWKDRPRSTVRVGTGSGNRKEQTNAITNIMAMQEKVLMNPQQALVKEDQVFNAINEFAKFSGLAGAGSYFIDPQSEEGQTNRQAKDESSKQAQEAEMQEKKMLAEVQTKIASAEESKARTAEQNVQLRAQVDQSKLQLDAMKNKSDTEISMLQQQLKEAEAILKTKEQSADLEYKYYHTDETIKLEKQRILATTKGSDDDKSKD